MRPTGGGPRADTCCSRDYAEDFGFTLLPIPVGVTEMQNQSAQWAADPRESPEFGCSWWGWGAMNAGAITEAVRTRYPWTSSFGHLGVRP